MPFVQKAKDFQTAGLVEEGIYFGVFQLKPETVTFPKSGDVVDMIKATILLQETPEEVFERPEKFFHDFSTEGYGLEQWKNFYKTVTGSLPTGDVDHRLLAEEVNGAGVWLTIYWTKEGELDDDGNIKPVKAKLGRRFAKSPDKLRKREQVTA